MLWAHGRGIIHDILFNINDIYALYKEILMQPERNLNAGFRLRSLEWFKTALNNKTTHDIFIVPRKDPKL